MSPIVRRNDGDFRSDHRRKVIAIQQHMLNDDQREHDTSWPIKETTSKGLYRLSHSPSPPSSDLDPDIYLSTPKDVPSQVVLDAFHTTREYTSFNGAESVGPRYSSGSNATYPPHSSESLNEVLAELPIATITPRLLTIRSAISLLAQSIPSLIISLVGLIFTGQLLDHLAVWKVFVKCDELFIAVPALQNLKGNLEMCLGAKLGTATNEGRLDTPRRRKHIITNSLFFLQYQALTISAFAGALSWLLGYAMKHRIGTPDALPGDEDVVEGYTKPGIKQLMLILSSGMLTASLSSAVLGNFISWLVVVCRWFGINPDNIASPLAACLGDFLTLFILALIGSALVQGLSGPIPWIFTVITILGTIGVRWYGIRYRISTRSGGLKQNDTEEEGAWWPLIAAMIISCATGVVLENSVSKYDGFALLGVTTTGICGSLGAIYASRLSTDLHADKCAHAHQINDREYRIEREGRMGNIASGLTLFIGAWPVQAFFLIFIACTGWTSIPAGLLFWFIISYALTAGISISAAHAITMFFWNNELDPDSYTLPIHSAMIDLVGQLLLVAAYELASAGGTKVKS